MKAPLHLSLVVPAYNEEARLPTSLPQIMAFANSQPFRVEVIIVNNNSGDRTRQIADEFARHSDCLRVIDQPIQGKGAAVRAGMLAANGDYCMIADADLSMPIAEVTKFLPPNVPTYDTVSYTHLPAALWQRAPQRLRPGARADGDLGVWPGQHPPDQPLPADSQPHDAIRKVSRKATIVKVKPPESRRNQTKGAFRAP